MTYTVLAVVGAVLAVGVDLALLRTMLVRHKAFWASYAIVLFFQLIMNGVLTGVPVVRYRRSDIIGLRIVYAPVEDLLFGFALVMLTLSLWVWWGRRGGPARPGPDR